ncbi:aldo/keto reductase [Psychrilyobacter atlanticus]|uniref:aldo/keto reductase n=1 Tax=Psychrilyobacter atlanticus TaxID=271091 RepID=UPI000423EF68|nr:aldo/keto reductase [Psychrilyobacter atlanticus]
MQRITLNNGIDIPIIGLGTFRAKEKDVYNAVKTALDSGYRHIDTAMIYGNEVEVGRAIKDSGVPREELFITTKLWNSDQGYETTKKAFDDSLKKLGLEYIDLYLIHWYKGEEKAADSWKAMEELYETGHIKSIGVSNFNVNHIEDLLKTAKIKPVINQVEIHLGLPQYNLQKYCESMEIKLEAYAPMQSGGIFANEDIKKIAQKHNKTIANIALKFLVDRGIIVLPKSIKEERILNNKNIFDFSLDENDQIILEKQCNGMRLFPDPDNCSF